MKISYLKLNTDIVVLMRHADEPGEDVF